MLTFKNTQFRTPMAPDFLFLHFSVITRTALRLKPKMLPEEKDDRSVKLATY